MSTAEAFQDHHHRRHDEMEVSCRLWRIDQQTFDDLAQLQPFLLEVTADVEDEIDKYTEEVSDTRCLKRTDKSASLGKTLTAYWRRLLVGQIANQWTIDELIEIGDRLSRLGLTPSKLLSIHQEFLQLIIVALTNARLGAKTLPAIDLVSRILFFGMDLLLSAYRTHANEIILGIELHQAKRAAEKEIEALRAAAHVDPLTGLFNRRYFQVVLETEFARESRSGEPLGILMLDIDCFKLVNDKYGHGIGDKALIWISEELRSVSRKPDTICRYGGEEFVILLPAASLSTIGEIAERFRQIVCQRPAHLGTGIEVPLSISIGAALHQPDEKADAFIFRADQALYRAKKNGRNCVELDQSGARR